MFFGLAREIVAPTAKAFFAELAGALLDHGADQPFLRIEHPPGPGDQVVEHRAVPAFGNHRGQHPPQQC